MPDPFAIEGPAVISFSGGRTSAYMLHRCLEQGIGDDVHIIFADTHKERVETLEFVDECERRWGFELARVERPGGFEKLIKDRKYLPNPVTRFCTGDLKVKPIRQHMKGLGYDFWTNVIGIRADEPRRVVKMRNKVERYWDYSLPLAEVGITEADVMAFWKAQDFDLKLRPDEGNCDLCFLKGKSKRIRIIEERPEFAQWWMDMEAHVGGTFRSDSSYKSLSIIADHRRRQLPLFPVEQRACETDDTLGDCLCGD